ncbi:MAG TPA: 50S ribosomal protein L21, partial [Candidatus Saccharimonadales bacterium]|nr:50S ribosomal protein L21 [Candidatus Saccharimonadales bacterium]
LFLEQMKKAVIKTGGKQYLVSEGETLTIERIKDAGKQGKLSFEALLVIDGEKTEVGTPTVPKATVAAEVVEADIRAEKVTSIRYKAKKRVRKTRGHRQHQTSIKISKISKPAS